MGGRFIQHIGLGHLTQVSHSLHQCFVLDFQRIDLLGLPCHDLVELVEGILQKGDAGLEVDKSVVH